MSVYASLMIQKPLRISNSVCLTVLVLQELGLPEDPNVPMLGFIGRLDYQKGVDLIKDSYEWIMGEGVQLVMLGSGRGDLEDSLR